MVQPAKTLRLLRAIAAGAVVYFIVGYLVFDVVLGPFSERHTTALSGFRKDDAQTLVWIGLSCLAYAALLGLLLVQWQPVHDIAEGLRRGAVTGSLVACMTDFYWYGTSHFYNSLLPVFADIAAAAVTVGIMAAVVVWAGRHR